MKKKRLLKLAALLEKDAKNKKGIKFDLDVIAAKSGDKRFAYGSFQEGDIPKLDCGTAACAVGLAVLSGAFKREGFTYKITDWGLEPKYKKVVGFNPATTEFFDLTERECEFLFHPEGYVGECPTGARGERLVAKRIRDFVAGKVEA